MQFAFLAAVAGLFAVSQAAPTSSTETVCLNRGITVARANRVSQAFRNARIVPEVIPSINPKVEVGVAYGNKVVSLGNKFSTLETVSEPTITFNAEVDRDPRSTKYVILFVDPDAPGPTEGGDPALLSPFLHLAVYDASPSCVTPANNGGGKTLAMYKPLTPLSVASHRYVQLVYRQPEGFVPPPELSYVAGALFDLNRFVTEGGLELVGGNYFLQGIGSISAVGK